jgi:hypothetical protein
VQERCRNPSLLPWKELGIDIVIEGTGVFVVRSPHIGNYDQELLYPPSSTSEISTEKIQKSSIVPRISELGRLLENQKKIFIN